MHPPLEAHRQPVLILPALANADVGANSIEIGARLG
jgi:hypothetical protein